MCARTEINFRIGKDGFGMKKSVLALSVEVDVLVSKLMKLRIDDRTTRDVLTGEIRHKQGELTNLLEKECGRVMTLQEALLRYEEEQEYIVVHDGAIVGTGNEDAE